MGWPAQYDFGGQWVSGLTSSPDSSFRRKPWAPGMTMPTWRRNPSLLEGSGGCDETARPRNHGAGASHRAAARRWMHAHPPPRDPILHLYSTHGPSIRTLLAFSPLLPSKQDRTKICHPHRRAFSAALCHACFFPRSPTRENCLGSAAVHRSDTGTERTKKLGRRWPVTRLWQQRNHTISLLRVLTSWAGA